MARVQPAYVCAACGAETAKWQGQCPQCAAWNTLEAATLIATGKAAGARSTKAAARDLLSLKQAASLENPVARIASGNAEFDRVVGGGLVPGSVTLLGGDPGIGKSTLLLQLAASVGESLRVLYASGEESAAQVGLRARRLQADNAGVDFLAETDLDSILAVARERAAKLLVVDSVQTVQMRELATSAGSIAQLRECTAALVRFAKLTDTAVVIVGHVTKEGTLAGPRVLEHLVDCVLYFESDSGSRFRRVRATKNRFGAIGELAFFAMTGEGLREVANPSAIFLARPERVAAGSIVTVARDGGRALLVELQALVDASRMSHPRRVAQGVDANRLSLLLAVLHRHAGFALQEQDVFVNLVGGLEVRETATDLAAALAVVSSMQDRALPADCVAFGEIGLTGEVRPVPYGEERLATAARHGFKTAIVPRANAPRRGNEPQGLRIVGVERVAEALEILRS